VRAEQVVTDFAAYPLPHMADPLLYEDKIRSVEGKGVGEARIERTRS